MLIEEGADKYVTNKHGLNCLHIAAQGDQPISLYYFHKLLNLNINEKDHRGSTPLHWAIFSCSELAMIYILTWLSQDQLSSRDEEGYTAMHLAIKSSHKMENSRTVRVLLYHGAPTNIRDQNGFTALDLVKNFEDSRIKQDIIKLLTHRTGLIEFLQYRNPLKKVSKSWKLPMAYLVFNLFIYLIFSLFTAPLWPQYYEIVIVIVSFAIATLFWVITMNMDPGFIKPYPGVDFLVSNST